MHWIIIGIIISYLIGSIPTAYLFGRCLKGMDIRKFGSGNVGATNALRVLGKPAGISVLIFDVFKGFLPVIFLGDLLVLKAPGISDEIMRFVIGLSCISGHNWTIFLKFKGGKGVATTLGVLWALAFKIKGVNFVLLIVILAWLITFSVTKIVSISSVVAAIAFCVSMLIFRQSPFLVLFSFILSFFIILRHKNNLKRLLQGKESKII